MERLLETFPLPEGWALDPFGTSPRLAIELGGARGVVAAFSNPITRFVLELRLDPPSPADLGSALARLAASPKDDTRLEKFLHNLYRSTCARCSAPTIVDHFIWDRELWEPTRKSYLCSACQHVGEDPTTAADIELALHSPGYGLASALAAERAAPAGDPDREHVVAALAVYPPRALYALITVLQKIDQLGFTPAERRAAQALFLSAADAANGLWGYPDTRPPAEATDRLDALPRGQCLAGFRAGAGGMALRSPAGATGGMAGLRSAGARDGSPLPRPDSRP